MVMIVMAVMIATHLKMTIMQIFCLKIRLIKIESKYHLLLLSFRSREKLNKLRKYFYQFRLSQPPDGNFSPSLPFIFMALHTDRAHAQAYPRILICKKVYLHTVICSINFLMGSLLYAKFMISG